MTEEQSYKQVEPSARWAPVLGRWRTSGYVVGDPETPVTGTDIYELLPGGHFVVHHVDVHVGTTPVRAIEILGEPADNARFWARSFDNTGATELMLLQLRDDGSWRFTGGPHIAQAAQLGDQGPATGGVRSTLVFQPDGRQMRALWERSGDGVTWTDWMHMTFDLDDGQ